MLKALVFSNVSKSLLLHASAIENISASHNLRGKLVALSNEAAAIDESCAELVWEWEGLREDKLDLDGVVAEQLGERVNGSAEHEITGEGDDQIVDGTQFLTDGEKIEDGLGWVLSASVT
jgi:hypothetical protein